MGLGGAVRSREPIGRVPGGVFGFFFAMGKEGRRPQAAKHPCGKPRSGAPSPSRPTECKQAPKMWRNSRQSVIRKEEPQCENPKQFFRTNDTLPPAAPLLRRDGGAKPGGGAGPDHPGGVPGPGEPERQRGRHRGTTGRGVYDFALTAAVSGEETVLTLTEPEWAAGLTARITGEEGKLEYDGLILETGSLDGEDLSPMSALPQLLEAARSGLYGRVYPGGGGSRGTFLRVRYADPDQAPGEGAGDHPLVGPRTPTPWWRGEISVDGLRVIRCTISEFTIGS